MIKIWALIFKIFWHFYKQFIWEQPGRDKSFRNKQKTLLSNTLRTNIYSVRMLMVDILTLAVFPVFRWAAVELTVNERLSPCPRGSMGCRRSGRRRGTRGSRWTSCCLLGSSSDSMCLKMTPSGASKKFVVSHPHFVISNSFSWLEIQQ